MDAILIGKLLKPHGLKGQIKAAFYIDDMEELEAYSNFYIKDNKEAAGYKVIRFDTIQLLNNNAVVSIPGCVDRTSAESFQGMELFVDESEVPVLKGDSYYIKDIEDCKVFNDNLEAGIVYSLFDAGNKNMLLIKLNNNKDVAVPFTNDYIEKVDVKEKKIFVKNLKELL